MIFIKTRVERIRHPLEEILEFEAAIATTTRWPIVTGPKAIQPLKATSRALLVVGTLSDRVSRWFRSPDHTRLYLAIGYISTHHLIYRTFPYFALPLGLRALWMYDAWENEFSKIEGVVRRHSINVLLLTSLQAAEHFNRLKLPRFKAYWVPEAITVSDYHSKPYAERNIDVLQFGRRWDAYHDKIVDFCQERGLVYLYEKTKGEIIFPRRSAFIDSLAAAKISICVPSSITHPSDPGKLRQ